MIVLSLSCKSKYYYNPIEIHRIQYIPGDTIEEKWIQPEYIYSELYPVT